MNVLKNKRVTIFIGVFTCENLAWYQTRDLPTQWFPHCSVTFHSGSQPPSAPCKGAPFQVASTLRGHLSVIVRLRSWHTQGLCVKKAFIGNFLFLSLPTPWWIFYLNNLHAYNDENLLIFNGDFAKENFAGTRIQTRNLLTHVFFIPACTSLQVLKASTYLPN